MTDAKTSLDMSPGLEKVAERARRNPKQRILALAQYIDEAALCRSYRRLRRGAAVGVDGRTVEQYGKDLESNVRGLRERMKAMKYRHQPIRRVYIPKDGGKSRPIGVSTVEDKVVQGAIKEVLEAIYEQDFLDCSHGFRPGRNAHDALRALDRLVWKGRVAYVLEADIVSFFDSLDRKKLMEMLRERIADESMMRLIGKCLHVGVLDGEQYEEPEAGTAQGSVLSPLLGNVYLHYVLDVWFVKEIKPRLEGESALIRYADDFVICFERESDARRVMKVLGQRMAKHGLTLHPDKTRIFPFQPPKQGAEGKGTATFDLLGFTIYWRKGREGRWNIAYKTRRARLARAIKGIDDWCRRHRHWPVKDQHAMLTRKLVGHHSYFGVNGNIGKLCALDRWTRRVWYKWLTRRSQTARLNWERFEDLLRDFPLPRPRIRVQIWG